MEEGWVAEIPDGGAGVVLRVACPGYILQLIKVEGGRQLPVYPPEPHEQRNAEHTKRPDAPKARKCGGPCAGRWYTPAHFTDRTPTPVFTSGHRAQHSSQTILAPPDAGPVSELVPHTAAPPANWGWPGAAWAQLRIWESSFALLLISTVYSMIQGSTQNIIGVDGYYHVKVALLMREQGWRLLAPLDFPWLQLTILGPGRYTDHHFLFHVLQAPFTIGDPRIGAKMAERAPTTTRASPRATRSRSSRRSA